MSKLGEFLKDARIRKRLTMRAVSELCQVSLPYISHLERGGRKNPSKEVLKKLADVYEIDYAELLHLSADDYVASTNPVSASNDLAVLLTGTSPVYLDGELLSDQQKQTMLAVVRALP